MFKGVIKKIKKFTKKRLEALASFSVSGVMLLKVGTVVIVVCVAVACAFMLKDKLLETLENTVIVSESEVLRRVATHTELPKDTPTLVRVQDAQMLRTQHAFYKDIKEGDYIIAYKDLIIIYDLRADKIIAKKSETTDSRQ